MWVRKRLDIGYADLARGVWDCLLPPSGRVVRQRVESLYGPRSLACLSVRSGLDLLLQTQQWPAGCEVMLTALTIPDMARIVHKQGLVPVPVDIDAATLSPTRDALQRALTPATRAIVVAHLMGGRFAMDDVLRMARRHRLLVVEDCAQAFLGDGYRGHPESDAAMFSFGSIKTGTALGGAIVCLRDAAVFEGMRARQAAYSCQPRSAYLAKLLKHVVIKGLSTRLVFAIAIRLLRWLGCDEDRLLNSLTRGFAGPDFFDRIRRQPSAPLLAMIQRRLSTVDGDRLQRRVSLGRRLGERLAGTVACPGSELPLHGYWVFPVLAEDPPALIAALRAGGFDATQGRSMVVVEAPPDRPQLCAATASRLIEKMVYVPLYPELPEKAVRRMAEILLAAAKPPAPVVLAAGRPATLA